MFSCINISCRYENANVFRLLNGFFSKFFVFRMDDERYEMEKPGLPLFADGPGIGHSIG